MRLQDELAGTENRIACRPQTLQRCHSGLQHLRAAVPQQHLGGHCRIQAEQRLLHGQPGGAAGAEREVLTRDAGLQFPAVVKGGHALTAFIAIELLNDVPVVQPMQKRPSHSQSGLSPSSLRMSRFYLNDAIALASSS